MPNTQILVPDIDKGETNDTPKKFRNIDTEDFEFSWDNVKTIVPAGAVIDLPLYKVNYAAMHLARKIYKRNIFAGKTEAERSIGIVRFVNPEEEWKLQQQMVADNFPKESQAEPQKSLEPAIPTPSIPEEKKEEVQETNPLLCKTCGFTAKSAFGLKSHQRKHKS